VNAQPAFRPQRSVFEIVRSVRAIHAWIDDEIAKGRTDDEIVAQAPLAIAFINGDLSLAELQRRVEKAHVPASSGRDSMIGSSDHPEPRS
jgi:hypothetical protein